MQKMDYITAILHNSIMISMLHMASCSQHNTTIIESVDYKWGWPGHTHNYNNNVRTKMK